MKNITLTVSEKVHLLQFVTDYKESTLIYDNILDDITLVSLAEKLKCVMEVFENDGPTAKLSGVNIFELHKCINV